MRCMGSFAESSIFSKLAAPLDGGGEVLCGSAVAVTVPSSPRLTHSSLTSRSRFSYSWIRKECDMKSYSMRSIIPERPALAPLPVEEVLARVFLRTTRSEARSCCFEWRSLMVFSRRWARCSDELVGCGVRVKVERRDSIVVGWWFGGWDWDRCLKTGLVVEMKLR